MENSFNMQEKSLKELQQECIEINKKAQYWLKKYINLNENYDEDDDIYHEKYFAIEHVKDILLDIDQKMEYVKQRIESLKAL